MARYTFSSHLEEATIPEAWLYNNQSYMMWSRHIIDERITFMDKTLALRFGRLLKATRKKRKLTQEKLAELADLSVVHIQRFEGRSPSGVTLETLIKLSRAFKISLPAFLKDL